VKRNNKIIRSKNLYDLIQELAKVHLKLKSESNTQLSLDSSSSFHSEVEAKPRTFYFLGKYYNMGPMAVSFKRELRVDKSQLHRVQFRFRSCRIVRWQNFEENFITTTYIFYGLSR
jgi:hypothetical protein